MKTIDPKITVLMPAYNAEKYIGEAIASVLDQTFRDFELLIINDGSTDQTEKIIRSFTDPRIRLVNQNNQGVAASLNKGLSISKGDYIARFDADDICMPQRLEKQFNFLADHPDYVLIGSDATYIDMNGGFVFTLNFTSSDEEIRNLPSTICAFSHVTVLYKKETVIEAGMYDTNAHTFEDHLLWHKIIKRGKVCNLNEVLVKVRFNPESLTIDDRWRGGRFKQLKYEAINNAIVSPEKGDEILDIIRRQNTGKIKKAAYYSLLSKKYLFNNFDRFKARENIRQLIKTYPLKLQGYMLMGLSCFPERLVKSIYKINKQ